MRRSLGESGDMTGNWSGALVADVDVDVDNCFGGVEGAFVSLASVSLVNVAAAGGTPSVFASSVNAATSATTSSGVDSSG